MNQSTKKIAGEFFALNFTVSDARFARSPVYATEQKISSFEQFRSGWCYGRGQAFSPEVIRIAMSLNRWAIADGFLETDAFPGPDGEVRVTIYYALDYLEFTVNPDLTVDFVREREGHELMASARLTVQNAEAKLKEFSKELWTSRSKVILNIGGSWISYVSSPGIGTTRLKNDSKTGLLKTQPMEAVYL